VIDVFVIIKFIYMKKKKRKKNKKIKKLTLLHSLATHAGPAPNLGILSLDASVASATALRFTALLVPAAEDGRAVAARNAESNGLASSASLRPAAAAVVAADMATV
jgi:hypothetical protein